MTNTIREPGKFEGEPEYVRHFWNHGDEADEVHEDGDGIVFRISAEDCKRWPNEFDIGDRLILWEDDNGFVHSRVERW